LLRSRASGAWAVRLAVAIAHAPFEPNASIEAGALPDPRIRAFTDPQ